MITEESNHHHYPQNHRDNHPHHDQDHLVALVPTRGSKSNLKLSNVASQIERHLIDNYDHSYYHGHQQQSMIMMILRHLIYNNHSHYHGQ